MTKKAIPFGFSWITHKITLKSSSIEGVGYYANTKIKKNEKLIVQSGTCIHINMIDDSKMSAEWYTGFQIEQDVYLYPHQVNGKPFLEGIFYINHSCEPSAGFSGQVTLVAMHDIEPGEEITYDYAMTDIETSLEEPWEAQKCLCNKSACRSVITGNDWRIKSLHKKYEGYFSTHVAKAVKQMSSNAIIN